MDTFNKTVMIPLRCRLIKSDKRTTNPKSKYEYGGLKAFGIAEQVRQVRRTTASKIIPQIMYFLFYCEANSIGVDYKVIKNLEGIINKKNVEKYYKTREQFLEKYGYVKERDSKALKDKWDRIYETITYE